MAQSEIVTERVGPVLANSVEANAVIAAIRAENLDVDVIDRGSYLRVTAPHTIHVSRAAVEERLMRPFVFPGDLEKIMFSFSGKLSINGKGAVWKA